MPARLDCVEFEVVHAVVRYGNDNTRSCRFQQRRELATAAPTCTHWWNCAAPITSTGCDRMFLHGHRLIDAVMSLANRVLAAGGNPDQQR